MTGIFSLFLVVVWALNTSFALTDGHTVGDALARGAVLPVGIVVAVWFGWAIV